jgi:hypothetical protein
MSAIGLRPSPSLTIPFGGKHLGRAVADLFNDGEIGYLIWVLAQPWLRCRYPAVYFEIWRTLAGYFGQGGTPPPTWVDARGNTRWRTASSYPGSSVQVPVCWNWQMVLLQAVDEAEDDDRVLTRKDLIESVVSRSTTQAGNRRRERAKRALRTLEDRGILVEDGGRVSRAEPRAGTDLV